MKGYIIITYHFFCRLPKGHHLHEQPVIRYTPEAKGNSVTIYAT